jgi:hypothetical protein
MINNMREPMDLLAMYDAQNAPPEPEPASMQALRLRAQEAGLKPGSEGYRAFMASGGVPSQQAQETIVFGADGRPVFVQAPAGTGATFTEGQSKDILYATRARSALENLDGEGGSAGALTNFWETAAELVPMNLGRYAQSPEFQTAQNAGDQFLSAILRKDTGAAITVQEQEIYGGMFLPRPGDTPEVQELKREARQQAVLAIEAGMGPDAILAQGRALVMGGAVTQPGTRIEASQVTPQTVPTMTEDQLTEYLMTTPGDQIPDDVWAAITARTGAQ